MGLVKTPVCVCMLVTDLVQFLVELSIVNVLVSNHRGQYRCSELRARASWVGGLVKNHVSTMAVGNHDGCDLLLGTDPFSRERADRAELIVLIYSNTRAVFPAPHTRRVCIDH